MAAEIRYRPPFYMITADYTGGIWLEGDPVTTDGGAAISPSIQTMYDDRGSPHTLKKFDEILIDGVATATADIVIYTKNEAGVEHSSPITFNDQTLPLILRGGTQNVPEWRDYNIKVSNFTSMRSITSKYSESEMS